MRLFIAINFTRGMKRALMAGVSSLRAQSRGGSFTREENLHLTLARRLRPAGSISLSLPPCSMTVSRVSLMKSERINGHMKYTEISGLELEEGERI